MFAKKGLFLNFDASMVHMFPSTRSTVRSSLRMLGHDPFIPLSHNPHMASGVHCRLDPHRPDLLARCHFRQCTRSYLSILDLLQLRRNVIV